MKKLSSREAVKEIAKATEEPKNDSAPAGGVPQSAPVPAVLSEEERKVLDAMKPDVPMLVDDISVPGMDVSAVLSTLTMLELTGEVESGAGGYFLRRGADAYFHTISEDAD